MAGEKRERKRTNRDAAATRYAEELRRRRLARSAAVGLVIALVVGLAIFTPRDDDDDEADPAAGRNEEVACPAEDVPEADPQQYDAPPDLTLPEGVDYSATIRTTCGDITVDLLEEAEATVANFIFLAEEGFYDGLTFHRVEANAVIQTGDPNGQNGEEPDGPGYSIPDEFPEKAAEYVYGVMGLANAGPGTGGSQVFFVVHDREGGAPAGYPPTFSIFGEVDSGSYDVLDEIANTETKGGNDPVEAVKPVDPIYITSIEINEG
ncbi:MAG TPA: peptidylprolyl isomerase [Actinomycetota bacterium]|nr:peptidylprolyl isomerase [Actinomycetota bacterium]